MVWRKKDKKGAKKPQDSLNPQSKKDRQVLTPEAVKLSIRLAGIGERASALILDLIFIAIMLTLLWVGLWVIEVSDITDSLFDSSWLYAFGSFATFIIFFFYFTIFEIRWHGTTLGKKIVGIRVMDRKGGRLSAESIFARNLMRVVELFIPLSLIFAPLDLAEPEGWQLLMIWIWLGIFMLLPFFNKNNMRAGDLIGGTWVVETPKMHLLRDVVEQPNRNAPLPSQTGKAPPPAFRFTRQQLDAYGIYELQTLENVLRNTHSKAGETRRAVFNKIARKIHWDDPNSDPKAFLEAYYTALRAHLENKMLFGVRRKDKFDTGAKGTKGQGNHKA